MTEEALAPDPDFEALLAYVRDARSFDFTGYKRSSLARRVRRRMEQVGIETFADYLDCLQVRPEEFTALFNTILINVTDFFRDPPAWAHLRETVIPQIIEAHKPTDPLRIWSAGCASGEEAYTLAMVFGELLGISETRERVKVYATDVDEDALSFARAATYDAAALSSVPEDLRDKYFEPFGSRFSFRKELRRSVIFGRNDLIQDAPISRVDLLVCRNALMYFNAETQGRVLQRFNFALGGGGYLFLGKAEMLLSHGELFTPVDLKRRVFRKVVATAQRDRALPDFIGEANAAVDAGQRLAEEALYSAPAAQVVLDDGMRLAFVNARAQHLFGVGPRDVGRLFQDLEMSYRPVELRRLLDQAIRERRPAEIKGAEWVRGIGDISHIDIIAVPLVARDSQIVGVSLTILDVTGFRLLQDGLEQANRQLETAYEELQSTNEELETTNEEMQSTVEELETTNEELQSTNEELETMNEELQSTNDELQAINDELRDRTSELARVSSFMDAVMAGMQAGVAVVDADLIVKVWNKEAEELWGVRADETVGRHLFSLDIGLPLQELPPLLRAAAEPEAGAQSLETLAVNRRGREVRVRVTASGLPGAGAEPGGTIVVMELVEAPEG